MQKTNSIKISILGDIAPVNKAGSLMLSDLQKSKNYLTELFKESSIVFANLELPLIKDDYPVNEDKKFVFHQVPEILSAFPEKMIFSLANNHIMDYGENGLLDTMKSLQSYGFRFTGAGINISEAGSPVIIDIDGIQIAFIAAADERYQPANNNSSGTFPAIPELIIPKIRELRKTVDIIYLSVHMGMEYIPVPTPVMKRLAKQCHDAGANVVFFHHSHCISGYTLSPQKCTLWGTGNFIFYESSDYPLKSWFDTAHWSISHDLEENTLDLSITPFQINENGLPERTDKKAYDRIFTTISEISNKINLNSALFLLRLKYLMNPNYIKVLCINYSDMIRRHGPVKVIRQAASTFKVLFLNR